MGKKNKLVTNDRVEVIDNDLKYRVCIDMRASGKAGGGQFVEHKGLKDAIEGLD